MKAFPRSGRFLTLVALAAALGLTACEKANKAGPKVTVDPEKLYGQMCARCHGADGKGHPQIKKMMPVRDLTDPAFHARVSNDQIERVIMAGNKQMPAFGNSLSAPKIQALTGYVRKLKAKE